MTHLGLSRRTLLGGGVATAAAVAGGTMLAGCTSNQQTSQEANRANAGVTLPTYTPIEGGEADLPASEDGVPAAYFQYPASPESVTSGPPLESGSLAATVLTNSPVPPSVDRNAYWQELNERIGGEVNLTIVPNVDYDARINTAVAGNNLGDMFAIFTGTITQLPAFLESQCQDLTEFVSGDAINDYPNLANIPTDSWRQCVFNGAIYTVPVPRGVGGSSLLFSRADLLEQRGLAPDFTSVDELIAFCAEATDERNNVWALSSVPPVILAQMLGLPNGWREENGTFTAGLEMEAHKDLLEAGRKLIDGGYVHPDSIGASGGDYKEWFGQGSGLMMQDTYTAIPGFLAQNTADDFELGMVVAPGPDGQPAQMHLGSPPNHNIAPLIKGEPDRIRAMLRVLDWLAAPFGSEEYLFRKYGIEGTTYELNGSDPVLTEQGQSLTGLGAFPIQYLTDSPYTIYFPGAQQIAQQVHDHMSQTVPTGIVNPTGFLYSDTWSRENSALQTRLDDTSDAILLGRQPVSSWDQAVADWRSGGGDQMRDEYAEAASQQ